MQHALRWQGSDYSRTKELKTGEIFELLTPFVPATIIEMLKSKGYEIYITTVNQGVTSYITR
jgi:hypothetical protein